MKMKSLGKAVHGGIAVCPECGGTLLATDKQAKGEVVVTCVLCGEHFVGPSSYAWRTAKDYIKDWKESESEACPARR